jgi:hypothetical protein
MLKSTAYGLRMQKRRGVDSLTEPELEMRSRSTTAKC